MNIVAIPDAPIKKTSKLLEQQTNAGFTNSLVDLSAFLPEYCIENREKIREKEPDHPCVEMAFDKCLLQKNMQLYTKQCQTLGMVHTIGKAPTLPLSSKREDLRAFIEELTKESIRICSELGCKYVIVEPIKRPSVTEDDREVNLKFYLSLADAAQKRNVQILIRNQYRMHNGLIVRGLLADRYMLEAFISELNEHCHADVFGVCLDIGTCTLCRQNPYGYIQGMGQKIKAVILRENDGYTDNSLLPFTAVNQGNSQMDWLNIIRGLRVIDFDGDLICDFQGSQSALTHLLRQDFICYAKKLVDFFAWQIGMERMLKKYEKRVLFGAGNMCRNYMKCYGKQYPPLFTCDNNESIWGSQFEGLTVKNPKALLDLPKDCAIVICNVFYEEIERQLLDMGIHQPIERFNDEYLPSMYTDRFDSEKREVR